MGKTTTNLQVAHLANALWQGQGGKGLAVSVADVDDYLQGSMRLSAAQRHVISTALRFLLSNDQTVV